ncbi:MAG TPA: ABC transporter permease [Thermoanaerobaculia bacterium]|nr:ABC transporter permease [Thermoanaerobaculia bacterium]
MMAHDMSKRRLLLLHSFLLTIILALWQATTHRGIIPFYLLPSPSAVLRRLVVDADLLLAHSGATVATIIGGFVLGTAAAAGLALCLQGNRAARHLVYPYVIALKSLPIVLIIPFVNLWIGTGFSSRVVIVALTSFFPTLVTTVRGLLHVDQDLVDVLRVRGATSAFVLFKVRVPSALPHFFAGAKVAVVLAVIGALVAEMMGGSRGLGFLALISTYRLDTDVLLIISIVSAIIGYCLFRGLGYIERKVAPWNWATLEL